MINSVTHPSVSAIFQNDKAKFYNVPKYQREYTWGKGEWSLLFNDVIENDKEYFLGSMICVSTSKGNGAFNDPVFEVIDGQQRITSLSILLAAIYSKLKEHYEILDEDQKTSLNNIKRELVIKQTTDDKAEKPRITPQIQGGNRDDYFSLLYEKGIYQSGEKKEKTRKSRIYRAFKFFSRECIDHYLEENNPDNDENKTIELLFDLAEKFNSAIMVVIEVETNKDAYMLFESLNNRGIPLSAIDLIKNTLISVSDSKNESEVCYSKWKEIIEYLGDDPSDQERFFRYFYDAYREELNKPFPVAGRTKFALGYVATKSNLMGIYEKLINKDYSAILDKLKNESKIYSLLINNADNDDVIKEIEEPLKDLARIQGAPSYILLMYLISNKEQLKLDYELINKIINNLISFFVRRNITDYPNTRNLVKIFMDSIEISKNNKGEEILNALKKHFKDISSSDEVFGERLRGPLYTDNPDATRFLLCSYENDFKTNEIYTDLWKKDDDKKYIWTIEHIFPEGENIPQCWVDMIADGDRKLANQYLDQYAHTLGNLTITGYNQKLSNFSFDKKRDRTDQKGKNFIGYKNGLKLNDSIVKQSEWKIKNITNRTEELVEYFANKFVL